MTQKTHPSIVLATLNAKYIHASLGLRYLLANLDTHGGAGLRAQTALREYTISRPAQEVVADLLALMGGAVVDDLSLSANEAACSVGGAASGWSVVDAAYGVIACAGEAGGPGMVARITVSTGPRIQLAAVDGWVMGSPRCAPS